MPLYDVTHKKDVLVKPKDSENYDVLQAALRNLDTRRFAKDVRIVDEALQQSVDRANAQNKLVFTKTGILVGHHSVTPTADTNHIWDSAEIAYPLKHLNPGSNAAALAGELQLKFVGGLVRWRISVLPDVWLVYRRESGSTNRFTGKEILVSEYWVNNNYPMVPLKHIVGNLMTKLSHAR
jgi:hypothetical protein